MSTLRLGKVEELVSHVTIVGRLVPESSDDYMKLVRLAWSFRRATELMIREVANNVPVADAVKNLYNTIPNYVYLESAYKHAKLVVGGARSNNGNSKHIHVKKLFIVSRGNRYDKGNRNVKLLPMSSYFEVLVRYPWDGSWIKCRAFFGEKYLPLLKELVELCRSGKEGYGARIVFRNGRIELHVSVPLYLYLKHFSAPKRRGYGLVAGLDPNSDRINMVVVDSTARIVAMKTVWFPEVTQHGFPRGGTEQIEKGDEGESLNTIKNI